MFRKAIRQVRKWRSEFDFARGALQPAVGPRYAQIEPTVRCNLKCIMCPRTLDPEAYRSADMTHEAFRRILDALPALERLQLSGFGEPFLHPELPEMIADATTRGITVSVNTNATVWTTELAERTIASGVDRIKLSLDAADPEAFRRIRGVDLDPVCEKICLVSRAKLRIGARRPTLSLNVVVQAGNAAHLDRFFALAEQLNVDRLRFKTALGFRVVELDAHQVGRADETAVRAAIARGREAAESSNVSNNFAAVARRLESQLDGDAGTQRPSDRPPCWVPQCLYPWFSTFISNRGVVRPCCKFYRDRMYDAGNAVDEPMRAIWHGDYYQHARRSFLSNRPIHAVCLDCDQHARSQTLLERSRRRYRWFVR